MQDGSYRPGTPEGVPHLPRLTHKLPFCRPHKPSGQTAASLGGRDTHLGPHGTKTSRAECDRAIAEWLATGRGPSAWLMLDSRVMTDSATRTLRGLVRGRSGNA